jgi:hypothetical protein
MLRRAGQIAIALALTGCTEQVVLHDVNDAGFNDADAVTRDPWQSADASCVGGTPITYNPQSAQVLILFDRSESMYSNFGSTSTTRAEVAQTALAECSDDVHLEDQVRIRGLPVRSHETPMHPRQLLCQSSQRRSRSPTTHSRVNNSIQCSSDARGSGCQATSTDSPSNASPCPG